MAVIFNRFPQRAQQTTHEFDIALGKVATVWQKAAQANAAVRTGRMRRLTRTRPVRPLHWRVQADAEYSGFVNDGTRFMRGSHWFDRAEVPARAELQRQMATLGGRLS